MPRPHGYSVKGQRCLGSHTWGSKGRTNVIGALMGTTLLTLSLIEGNVDHIVFDAWLENDLLPKLTQSSVIIMDNATFHKSKDMQEKIKATGHILEYLPPYSPDLNPIEHKWAKAKSIRRKNKCSIEDIVCKHQIYSFYKAFAIQRSFCR